MKVAARLARTACECGWPVYAITSQGKLYLVGSTGKRVEVYEVPGDTAYIVSMKPVASGLKFTVYDFKLQELGLIWYRAKRGRWEAWGDSRVQFVMEALARVLGTPPKPLAAPDYP